ncbi:MAG: hypothetical protein ACWA6U_15305 [Breznakibacter sp.]
MKSFLFFVIGLLLCSNLLAQWDSFRFKREIQGGVEGWHRIVLPDDVYGRSRQNLSDLRIMGVAAGKDTLEVPFVLKKRTGEKILKPVAFKLLNVGHDAMGYHYELQNQGGGVVNQLHLSFKDQNFDYRVKLSGSHDRKQWFTILEDYRIVSIMNEQADFRFSRLFFSDVDFAYIKVFVPTKDDPGLDGATMFQEEVSEGDYRKCTLQGFRVQENRDRRQTEVSVSLAMPYPVSRLQLFVSNGRDFARPLLIYHVFDSIRTNEGWWHQQRFLSSGMLHSRETNVFEFSDALTRQLEIVIRNEDNQPLTVDSVVVQHAVYELWIRFPKAERFFLMYGHDKLVAPRYDIVNFLADVSDSLDVLPLGDVVELRMADGGNLSLFRDNKWLWLVMVLIIGVLGWFSIKMMRGSHTG